MGIKKSDRQIAFIDRLSLISIVFIGGLLSLMLFMELFGGLSRDSKSAGMILCLIVCVPILGYCILCQASSATGWIQAGSLYDVDMGLDDFCQDVMLHGKVVTYSEFSAVVELRGSFYSIWIANRPCAYASKVDELLVVNGSMVHKGMWDSVMPTWRTNLKLMKFIDHGIRKLEMKSMP